MVLSLETRSPAERAQGPTVEALFDLFPALVGFLRGRGLGAEEAQDLAQETLWAAWESRDGYRQEASLKTWVFGVAKKKWLEWRRNRGRLKRDGIELALAEDTDGEEVGVTLESGDPDPEAAMLARERYELVRSSLATLPREMSAALVLHVEQERSYKEIAALLRSNVNHVSSLIYQARQKLRRAAQAGMAEAGMADRGSRHGGA